MFFKWDVTANNLKSINVNILVQPNKLKRLKVANNTEKLREQRYAERCRERQSDEEREAEGFCFQTNRWTDICDCRVASAN